MPAMFDHRKASPEVRHSKGTPMFFQNAADGASPALTARAALAISCLLAPSLAWAHVKWFEAYEVSASRFRS